MECPICMDAIEVNKNYITTECGHCFHANCLMKNVARNGFGCPYCRATMAERIRDDDDDDDEADEIYDDDTLRGLRFFTNNLLGNNHVEDDIDAELDYQEELLESTEEEQDETIPTTQFVSDKLRQQGITYEQLVSLILLHGHEEYESETLERLDGEIFGKIRIIVSNYTREQAVNETMPELEEIPALEEVPQPVNRPIRRRPIQEIIQGHGIIRNRI